jgi:hypothetical protein
MSTNIRIQDNIELLEPRTAVLPIGRDGQDEIDSSTNSSGTEPDRLRERTEHNALTPICRLPADLLILILRTYILAQKTRTIQAADNDDTDETWSTSWNYYRDPSGHDTQMSPYGPRSSYWLHLTQICSHIRNIALAAPTLWQHIDLDATRWAHICLERGGGTNTSLYVATSKDVEKHAVMLKPHSHRIRFLDVAVNVDHMANKESQLDGHVPFLEHTFPNLVEMGLFPKSRRYVKYPMHSLFLGGRCDTLVSLCLIHQLITPDAPFPQLPALEFLHLGRFTITGSCDDLVDMLKPMPRLRTLVLINPNFTTSSTQIDRSRALYQVLSPYSAVDQDATEPTAPIWGLMNNDIMIVAMPYLRNLRIHEVDLNDAYDLVRRFSWRTRLSLQIREPEPSSMPSTIAWSPLISGMYQQAQGHSEMHTHVEIWTTDPTRHEREAGYICDFISLKYNIRVAYELSRSSAGLPTPTTHNFYAHCDLDSVLRIPLLSRVILGFCAAHALMQHVKPEYLPNIQYLSFLDAQGLVVFDVADERYHWVKDGSKCWTDECVEWLKWKAAHKHKLSTLTLIVRGESSERVKSFAEEVTRALVVDEVVIEYD